MAKTYEPISTTTIGTAINGVTFSSIPATYTDLILVVYGRITGTSENLYIQFNGDTSSGSYQTLYSEATASGVGVGNETSLNFIKLPDSWNGNWGMLQVNINGYRRSFNKRVLLQQFKHDGQTSGTGNQKNHLGIGQWSNTAAINQIYIYNAGGATGNFAVGTKLTLFGILEA